MITTKDPTHTSSSSSSDGWGGALSLAGLFAFTVAVESYLLWQANKFIQGQQKEIQKQATMRQGERFTRISDQRQAREKISEKLTESGYGPYPAIGVIESPFPDRRGTPRQPQLVPAARGRIKFNKKIIQQGHYDELREFSHVWIIFVFHENTNTDKVWGAAKIQPPRLGKRIGCLSTRSPHRPNNLGLSVCEIAEIGPNYIDILCCDMVDGTPVLDIKPYIPYDIIPSDLKLPMLTASNGLPLNQKKLVVPGWIVEADIPMVPVRILPAAQEQMRLIHEGGGLRMCTLEGLEELAQQVLRQDVRGVHQGRGTTNPNTNNNMNLEGSGDGDDKPGGSESDKDKKQGRKAVEESNGYLCRLDTVEFRFLTLKDGIEIIDARLYGIGNML